MSVTYIEKSTLGMGWSLEVIDGLVVVGHIRRRPDTKAFRYFRGQDNELNPTYENKELEKLKIQVENNP